MLQLLLAGSSIHRAAQEGHASERSAQLAVELAVMPLDSRLDQLELACCGMWELLRDRFGLTDAELIAKIEEIDLRDGKLDGKMKPVAACPNCHRRLLTRSRVRCVWCGFELPKTSFMGS